MNSILIRAEDKNLWERRTPLIPNDLKTILQQTKAKALVEKSDKRVFSIQDYLAVGAQACNDMQPGDIILGIKEIPVHKILENKVYLFFSHTIKGLAANMPMLKQIIESGSTLIDYEKITDEHAKRLIFFGTYAGDAGAIDILWLMGQYWQFHRLETPFLQLKQALDYQNLAAALRHLRQIGDLIKTEGLPDALAPLVIGILGYGHVSKGVQQVFNCLPTERIAPPDLPRFIQERKGTAHKIYLTIFEEKHLVRPKAQIDFDLNEYYQHPENFESQFESYLPDINILVNAVYWDARYPRFVTWDSLKKLYSNEPEPRLQGIADITCDVNGSIECNVKTTNSGAPAYICNPFNRTVVDGYQGKGVLMLAVDNLPAEIPYDSSVFFSNQLKPFIPNLIETDFSQPLKDSGLMPALQRGVIVYQGKLTEPFQYLKQFLKDI